MSTAPINAPIIVPLRRFVGFVHELEGKPRRRSLDTLQWLVENFSFDDRLATFAPVEDGKENREMFN
jgi:hypothetical protein